MTEYSGMKFGLFYLAQYLLNFLLCAITATIFFGGWQGPGVGWLFSQAITPTNLDGHWIFNLLAGVLGVSYFLAKTYAIFFVMIWIRGAYPRLRVDQLMEFGWKFLIPLAMVNIFSAAIWLGLTRWGAPEGLALLEGWTPFMRWATAFVVTLGLNLASYIMVGRIYAATQAARSRAELEDLRDLALSSR